MAKNVVSLGVPVLADGVEVSCTGKGAVSALLAILLVASPLVMMPRDVEAATLTVGPVSSSAEVNDSSNIGGTVGGMNWQQRDRVRTSNNDRASVTLTPSNDTSRNLKMTGYGFNIPLDATIDGIQVSVERRQDGPAPVFLTVRDYAVRLVTNAPSAAATSTQNKAQGGFWTTADSIATYGGSTDTWGNAWTPAQINHSSFGLLFAARSTADFVARDAQIDHVTISVTYTEAIVDPGDVTAPVLAEVTPVSNPTGDTTPSYTFNSDEEGTITYGGSCTGATTNALVGNNTIDLSVSDGVRNDCTITVTDLSANANVSLPLAISPFVVDSTGPTATVTSTVVGATSMSPIEFQIQFSEAVTGFSDLEGDVGVTNATLDSFTAGHSGTVYRVSVTPIADGDVTVSVASGVAQDSLLNGNSSGSYTVEYDTTGPGVAIESPAEGSVTDDATPFIDFTYTGDTFAATCEFDGDDFDCLGTGDFTPVDPVNDGEYTFTIMVEDELGNESVAEVNFTVDTTGPEVTISSSASNPTNVAPIPVTVEFNETVTGFAEGDVSVTNGTIVEGSFAGSGDTYGFNVAPASEGEVLVDIAANAADDAAGNGSEAGDQFSITYDITAPTLTLDSGPAEASLNGPDVDFGFTTDGDTVECNVDGTGLVACDSSSAHALSNLTDGSHTFLVRASDLAGNSVSSGLRTFDVDATGPEITEVTPIATPSTDTTPLVDLGLSEDGDITYGGACVSLVTSLPAGSTAITLEALVPGTYSECTVTATDSFGNEGNTLTLTSFTIEETPTGGGGGGGGNNNDEDVPTPDEIVSDLGGAIANLFGGAGNPGGNPPAGDDGEDDAGAGGGEEEPPADLGAPEGEVENPNTNLLAAVFSALGFDEVSSWLLALIAAILAALGYGGWFAFRKWKGNNNA